MSSQAEIKSHFTAIARRYERANTLLSFGIERSWRRRLLSLAVSLKPGDQVLDICTGTAGIIRDLHRVHPGCHFTGIDLTPGMLREGARLLRTSTTGGTHLLVNGDAACLPVSDSSVDLVTIGFGLRNLPDASQGIGEMARVLRRGGRIVIMEFAPVQPGIMGRVYGAYRTWLIPLIGGIITGAPDAYRHLSRSIHAFAAPEKVISLMRQHGLSQTQSIPLTAHIAYLYVGTKT